MNRKIKPNYKDLCEAFDEKLVFYCLENYRPAWDEFFLRFIPVIKNSIRETLNNERQYDLVNDIDIIGDIHEVLVIKLYKQGVLAQCTDLDGIKSWLKTMAHNQTVDWLKARGRIKRLPERQSEAATTSLSTPVSNESQKTLGDYVLGSNDPPSKIDDDPEELLSEREKNAKIVDHIMGIIGEIVKPKKKWAIRLCLIAYVPLSIDEVEELVCFSSLSREVIVELLNFMMKDVKKKEQKKEKDKNTAILYLYVIQKMEVLLAEKEKASQVEYEQEIIQLRKKLQKKREKREEFLASIKKISRPSNKDIASLIGVPNDKVEQITNIFNRGCRELTRKLDEN